MSSQPSKTINDIIQFITDFDSNGKPINSTKIKTGRYSNMRLINLEKRLNLSLPSEDNTRVNPGNFMNIYNNDIIIRTKAQNFNGAKIDCTLLSNVSELQNVLCYYIYPLNREDYDGPTKLVNNIWVPMTKEDMQNYDIYEVNNIKLFAIFPNTQIPNNNNYTPVTLQLTYNIDDSDCYFPNNTGIGFAIIKDGSRNFANIYEFDFSSNEILYSDPNFNYIPNPFLFGINNVVNLSTGAKHMMLMNDHKNSTGNMAIYCMAFENHNLNLSDHRKYDDVRFQLTISPGYSIDINKSIPIFEDTEVSNSSFKIGKLGLFLRLISSDKEILLNNMQNNFTSKFDGTLIINSNDVNYINKLKLTFDLLNFAFPKVVSKTTNSVSLRLRFDASFVASNILLLKTNENVENTNVDDVQIIYDLQDLLIVNQNKITSETFTIRPQNSTATPLITITEFTRSQIYTNISKGDPYITDINGESKFIGYDNGIYQLYSDGELIINTKLDLYPPNLKLEKYGKYLYMYLIAIKHNDDNIIFDMFKFGRTYKIIKTDNNKEIAVQCSLPNWITFISKENDEKNTTVLKVMIKTKLSGYTELHFMFDYTNPEIISSLVMKNNGILMNSIQATGAFINNQNIRLDHLFDDI